MSKYTTEVRYICETKCGIDVQKVPTDVDTIIDKSRDKIFGQFPIFSEYYRATLEDKILKHYYFREIGFETFGMWRTKLNTKMNEIMPYYNQLYLANFNGKDPFENVDYTIKIDNKENTEDNDNDILTKNYNKNSIKEFNTEDTRNIDLNHNTTNNLLRTETDDLTRTQTDNLSSTTTNNLTEHTTTEGEDWNLYSDTPQGSVSRIDVNGNNYLTNATKNTKDDDIMTTNSGTQSTANTGTQTIADEGTKTTSDSGTSNLAETGSESLLKGGSITDTHNGQDTDVKNSKSTVDFVKDYLEHVKGKMGGDSYAKMFKEYVDALLNIDMMIIDELSDLFMNLW